jgi:hypothetical protein
MNLYKFEWGLGGSIFVIADNIEEATEKAQVHLNNYINDEYVRPYPNLWKLGKGDICENGVSILEVCDD